MGHMGLTERFNNPDSLSFKIKRKSGTNVKGKIMIFNPNNEEVMKLTGPRGGKINLKSIEGVELGQLTRRGYFRPKFKISDLTTAPGELTGAELVEIVQSGVSYKTTVSNVRNWIYTSTVNTTSGTAITVTSGIPSTAVQIEVLLNGVSTSSNNQPPIINLRKTFLTTS